MTDDSRKPSGWTRDPRLGLAGLAVSVVALGVASASWLTGGGFNDRVRTYLLEHPEVLDEMLRARDAQQLERATEATATAIATQPTLLAHDPRDPAVGPAPAEAAVTVIQFFDYRCPACKQLSSDYLALIEANPDVRFVFKEWPILDRGDEQLSYFAARAALAAHEQGRYLAVHRALMSASSVEPAAVEAVLRQEGVDLVAASAVMSGEDGTRHVADVSATALALSLIGTPSIIVNGRLAASNDPAYLARAIDEARRARRS